LIDNLHAENLLENGMTKKIKKIRQSIVFHFRFFNMLFFILIELLEKKLNKEQREIDTNAVIALAMKQ